MNLMRSRRQTAIYVLSCLGALAVAKPASAETRTFPASTFTVSVGQRITVGTASVTMTSAGDLQVEDADGAVLWRSGTRALCANSPCTARFQNDHNLVVANAGGTAMSLSGTSNQYEVELRVSDAPPYLAVGAAGAAPVWRSGTASFKPGELTLSSGQRVAFDGVNLSFGDTGEVQVRRVYPDALLWSTGALANPSPCPTVTSCTLVFSNTGALTVNGPSGAVWTTGVARAEDGNAVAQTGNPPQLPVKLVLSKYDPHLSVQQLVTTPGKVYQRVLWGTGPDINAMTYAGGALKLLPGEKRSVGGVSLALTAAGQVQLLNEGTGASIWSPGSSCSNLSQCDLRLQGDGNFGHSGGNWSAGTAGNNGSTVTLSNKAPNLTVDSPRHDRLWSPSGRAVPVARADSPPVRGYIAGQTSSAVAATTVQSFLDSLGVNTHHDQAGPYNGAAALVRDRLLKIGVRNVREHAPVDNDKLAYFALLAQTPPYVRFNLVINQSDDVNVFVQRAQNVANLMPATPASPTGALDAVEGLNEINNFAFNFDSFLCGPGAPNACGGSAAAMQAALFNAMKNSTLALAPVYDLTDGLSAMHAYKYGLADFAGRAHFGTVHPYPSASAPHLQPYTRLSGAMNSAYDGKRATQGVITETGYQAPNLVSERAQAIMGINLWLDGYRLGYRRTFLYELFDSGGTEKYGMHDVHRNPKKLALAAQNLTTILKDTGAPLATTGSLPWIVSPAFTGHSLLLQKSDGAYYLILWREDQQVAAAPNAAGPVDLPSASPVSYTFTVPANKTVNVYDPIVSASAKLPSTFNPANNTVKVDLGVHPLIVEIKTP